MTLPKAITNDLKFGIVWTAVLVAATACGGGDGEVPETDDEPIEAAPANPLVINSTDGCAVDRDCQAGRYCFMGQCSSACEADADCPNDRTCTDRGKCVVEADADNGTRTKTDELGAEYDGLRVVEGPTTTFRVDEGQTSVTFSLKLNRTPPEAGLPYRIDRSDDGEVTREVEYAQTDTETVDITIPVGNSDPGLEDSTEVRAKLFTPVGNYDLLLSPKFPASGSYNGTATLKTFGTTGLPIEFEIVTQPDGRSLQGAERAWLVLPVGPQYLFSPVRGPGGSAEYVARELEYDEFVERWVATFEGRFDMTDGRIINTSEVDQVRRSLRFELERLDAETFIGAFNDRWSGLYEARSTRGVEQLKDVTFDGEIEVSRITEARSHEDVQAADLPEADPTPPAAPPVDKCGGTDAFSVDAFEPDSSDDSYDCERIDSAQSFRDASPDAQASCALAVSKTSLEGETTIKKVEAYLNGEGGGTEGMSFADFMEKCAANEEGLCEPSQKVRCGRQLVAHAYDRQGPDSTVLDALVRQYHEATRETFFGRQVAAFSADTSLRMDWLQSTNWPETFQGLKDLVGSMLQEWKRKVLQAHLGALKGQFDPSGLAVLSRQVEDADAAAAREQLLVGMTQNWRGAIDALTLATKRWNVLYESDEPRAEKSEYVSGRMFDLYLAAGLLRNLNTAAGAGYLSARLAGGFDVLVTELGKLSKPFSDLIYARDGEVAVSTSLDPTSDNATLIGERRERALDEIEEAQNEVTTVLDEARAEALQREQLENEMERRIDAARTELLEMCGRPAGCEDVNYLEGEPPEDCRIRVKPGKCGFNVDRETDEIEGFETGQQNTSEAGRVLLKLVEASKNITIADAERKALIQRIQLRYKELEAFKKDIDERNQLRTQFLEQLRSNIAKRSEVRNEAVKEVFESMAKRAELRQKRVEESKKRFEKWNKLEGKQSEKRLGLLVAAESSRITADTLDFASSTVSGAADVAAEGIPTGWSDAGAGARLGVKAAAFAASTALEAGSLALNSVARGLDIERAKLKSRQEAKMTELKREFKVDKAKWRAEIAKLQRQEKKKDKLTDAQLANLKETIELSRQYLEAELAHRRDLAKFRKKRTRVKEKLTKVQGLNVRVEEARLQFHQVMERYLGVVQRAKLADSKLTKLVEQRTNINSLIGSPGVVFSRANELEAAERSLFDAKQALMDWLVALEYYAVRPFIDQRMQILLARNTYQLEKIADELRRLENNCGGPSSEISTTLSVREDLMGLETSTEDSVTGEQFTPAERFREVLNRGHVPVDKRIRYSTDDTVGSLMSRSPDIMAGTFFIDLTDFANLELSCNAKVKSVAVNLVGEALGEARPTVTMLYDGTSKLRSCQPGIEEYVELIDETATRYGKISRFHTPGRSMSPVATVNGFEQGEVQVSDTLSGLPLASQYTLLVNKSAGENDAINWGNLEDIELKLTYSYQDVFPEGQCEL